MFANISEAQYPQSLADMLSKFEIARKECMETLFRIYIFAV
ncbi:MAG: four helix bundle protein [Ruminococcaceae bacterium]|nr:four helix bundle protein [Oscillospiraceae bacterium]